MHWSWYFFDKLRVLGNLATPEDNRHRKMPRSLIKRHGMITPEAEEFDVLPTTHNMAEEKWQEKNVWQLHYIVSSKVRIYSFYMAALGLWQRNAKTNLVKQVIRICSWPWFWLLFFFWRFSSIFSLCVAMRLNALKCIEVRYNTLQYVVMRFNAFKCIKMRCNAL